MNIVNNINYMEPNYGEEEIRAVNEYMNSGGWLTEYTKTFEFQDNIAAYLHVKNCSVMANGTVTLIAALMACGVGKDDEVIVPDFTMAATAHAVAILGAKPIFAEIEYSTLCIDMSSIIEKFSCRTKAIIMVDLNGRCSSNIKKIVEFCKEKKIYLIEDAAQALGSMFQEKKMGTFGDIGSFSFSMPKIITTGQGGALVTDNNVLFKKILQIRDFGREKSGADHYMSIGCNFKYTDLQAVIGIEQLRKIDNRVERKKEMGRLYEYKLENINHVNFIHNSEDVSPCFFEILCEEKEKLSDYLKENGIFTRMFYPPLHSEPAYRELGSHFPVTEAISNMGMWLPSSTKLSDEEICFICKCIKNFFI